MSIQQVFNLEPWQCLNWEVGAPLGPVHTVDQALSSVWPLLFSHTISLMTMAQSGQLRLSRIK